MKGMGGAVPSEFAEPGDYVSNMFAAIDRDRAAVGKPPMAPGKTRSWSEDEARAMAEFRKDPDWITNLIPQVQANPRPLMSWEQAGMVFQKAKWKAELNEAYKRINQFHEQGDQESKVNSQTLAADLEDRIEQMDKAVGRGGTGSEAGRSLQAQKMGLTDDLTLVEMVMQKRAALGGRRLTEKELKDLTELQAKLEATQKEYDAYVAKAEGINKEFEKQLEEAKRIAATRPTFDKRILDKAEQIVKGWEFSAKASEKKAAELMASLTAGINPELVYHLAIVGRAKIARAGLDFAKFGDEMVKQFGEKLRPHLQQVWDEANKLVDESLKAVPEPVRRVVKKMDNTERIEVAKDKIEAKMKAGDTQISEQIKRLERVLIDENPKITRDEVLTKLHDIISPIIPDITKREIAEAIVDYGKYKTLSKDEADVRRREIRGELQQVLRLEDIEARKPTPLYGVERQKPSAEHRQLIQKVEEAKRRYGVIHTDPERQIASAIDRRKTAVRNQIEDLNAQIKAKQRFVKTKTPTGTDAELEAMIAERDARVKELDSLVPRPVMTPEQRLKMAERSLDREIDKLDLELQQGILNKARQPKAYQDTPAMIEKRAWLAALREHRQEMRDLLNPKKTPEQRQLQALKTRLVTANAEYMRRIREQDFTPKARKVTPMDAEATHLKAENERIKKQYRDALIADRLANRPNWVKLLDVTTKVRRAEVLSSPIVFPKLLSAGVQRLASIPLEDLAGGVLRHVPGIRGVAEKAPLEGRGENVVATLKGYAASARAARKAAFDVLKTGHSEIDVLYGKAGEGYSGEMDLGGRILSLPGRTHGFIKAPVKQAIFDRAVQRLSEFYARQGLDVTDELVKTRIATEAYKAANRSIFLQDNVVTSGVNAMLRRFEQPTEKGGSPTPFGKSLATTGRFLLPIVKVPTNIVGETFTYAFGLPTGLARISYRPLLRAIGRQVSEMSPEEADLIMRQLKKGSIGGAALMLGFLNPNAVGGYYQPGKKRPETDVKPGEIRMFGVTVPKYLLHNPLLETIQFGATVRRVADAKLRKRDTDTQGVWSGLISATLGLIEEVPFVREMAEIEKARNPYTRGRFWGEQWKSIIVPAVVSKAAEWTDAGHKRAPVTTLDYIKTGIPGLRQTVPEKK